jgi:ParB/RepB/Spo0J family partition protein
MNVKKLSTNEIRVGYHPRKDFRWLEELKESIQTIGLTDDIRVRSEEDHIVVIDGKRRLQVIKDLGWETVPCIIEEIDERTAAHQSYLANAEGLRKNLNPIEVSLHIKEMRERFGYSVQDLVNLGYGDDQTIYHKLSLLTLPQEIQDKIAEGKICPTIGYELARPKNRQIITSIPDDFLKRKDVTVSKFKKKVRTLIDSAKSKKDKDGPVLEIPQGDIPGVFFKDSSDMSELPDESVGLIVTSPPYCVNFEYEKGINLEEHIKILRAVFSECVRVTVPGGKICVNVGDIRVYGTRNGGKPEIELIGHHIQNILREKGVRLVDIVTWKKGLNWINNPQVSYHDKIQHTTYRILNNTEYIYVFQKDGKRKVTPQMEKKSKISKNEWKTLVNGIWEITPVRNQKDHPAQFPDELPRRLIKMFSYKGDLVLDPFGGTMTTVKVARELGRIGVGYEKEEKYKRAIMKKLGIKSEDINTSTDTNEVSDLVNDDKKILITELMDEVLPSIVEDTTRKGEVISRLTIPLKRNLSKDDVTVETVPEDDDPTPPTAPLVFLEEGRPDDYPEDEKLHEVESFPRTKAA